MAEVTGLRNNALPYPVYGAPWGVVFPMLDADGDLVTGATTPDAEVSKNGDTFADCTNESTEIATNSGVYYLLLTATEMTADVVAVIAKSATAGMKTTVLTFYPRKLVSLRAGTVGANAADGTTLQLDSSAVAIDDYYNGCLLVAVIDSVTEARVISDYAGSTKVCTVSPAFNTAPDNNDTFTVYLPEGRQITQSDMYGILGTATSTPATAGILDVNLKNIANATVSTTTAQLGVNAVQAGGTAWGSGAITAASIAADAITAAKVADGTIDAATFAAGAITATVIADGAIDAGALAADAITAAKVAADVSTEINAAVLAILGTPAGASMSADIAAIEAQTDDIGVAGAGLTDLGGMSTTMKAQVEAEVDDALGGPGTGTALTAIPWNAAWDAEVQSEVDDALVAQNLDHLVKIAVDTDFATTVHLNSVVGYLADNGTSASFDRTTDSLEALQAENDATQSSLATAQTDISAILVDTGTTLDGRIPAALVGGRMDSNVGAISSDATAADNAEAFFDGTGYAGTGNVIPTVTTVTTTTNLTNAATNGDLTATMKASVNTEADTALSDVGLTTTVTGRIDRAISAILTTAMTEAYNTDGSAATPAQALYVIMQRLTEFSISGTTITAKKLDGSTTAFTLTLDSSTTPTSSTRAS